MGDGGVMKGFHGNRGRQGGLVTPTSPRARIVHGRGREGPVLVGRGGMSSSRGGGDGPWGAYSPSPPDSSSDADAYSLRRDSTDSDPNSLSSKDTGSVRQLETPESSVNRAPMRL
jgi:hypothetical protein